jgi:peroxiredoxin family protein
VANSTAVFFLSTSGYQSAWTCASLAATAQATGDTVWVVLGFDALREFLEGRFGAASAVESEYASRQLEIGAASPLQLLDGCRALGGKLVACDTTFKLVSKHEADRRQLDRILGLTEIWSSCRGARVLSF